MRLYEINLNEKLDRILTDKLDEFNFNHPDDLISYQDLAELLLEYGIRRAKLADIEHLYYLNM